MTLEEIIARVGAIKDAKFDDERAHCMEDELRSDFIFYIAEAGRDELENLQEKAEIVLSTSDISFARWCA